MIYSQRRKNLFIKNFAKNTRPNMEGIGRTYSCKGSMLRKLSAHMDESKLPDVTLKVGQQSFPAHRIILAAWSEHMAKMWTNCPAETTLELLPDSTEAETQGFKLVLRFLYTGEISLTRDNVEVVVGIAIHLDIKKLADIASKWVSDMIERGDIEMAITWMRSSTKYNLPKIRETCVHTLAMYSPYIPEALWLGLSLEEVSTIIDQDALFDKNEEAVLERVDAWLTPKGNSEDNLNLYEEMASKIRWQFIESAKLVTLQETSPLMRFVATSKPTLLSDAFKFRALSADLARKEDGEDACAPVQIRSLLEKAPAKPRNYYQFIPPGEGQVNMLSSEHDGSFQVRCILQKPDGSWKTTNSFLRIDSTLEHNKMESTSYWSRMFIITPMNVDSLDPEFLQGEYSIFVHAKPEEFSQRFSISDHPVVSCRRGCTRDLCSTQDVKLKLEPLFAGRKSKVFVTTCAYFYQKLC